jgi:hypothetical protein
MLNTDYAYKGCFIAAELDQDGEPTGRFLVIDSNGQVIHVAATLTEAWDWIDDLVAEERPVVKPMRPGR